MRHPVGVRNDYSHTTPAAVTGAVACGVAPIPLLAVYAVVFLIHGSVKPVHPPDITNTTGGELMAGCVAVVLIVALTLALYWFVHGSRRWPLAVLQVAGMAAFVDFVVDPTRGGRPVAAVLVLTSLASLLLMFAPSAWWWLDRSTPRWIAAPYRLVLRRPKTQPAEQPAAV
jgi:hypothetical protein